MSMAGDLSGFGRHSFNMNGIGYGTVIDAVLIEAICEGHREHANHGVEKWVGSRRGVSGQRASSPGRVGVILPVR
jgi:hypothetical protein